MLILLAFVGARASVCPAENLALRKRYTLSPKPNYQLCTDAGDAVQLTDGVKRGSNWTQESTVGWRLGAADIEITIDLGGVRWIDAVRLFSVGGGFSYVNVPESVAVLVSEDAQEYRLAGLVDSDELAVEEADHTGRRQYYEGIARERLRKRQPQTLSVEGLAVQARYVRLMVHPKGIYFFADEVEIAGVDPVETPKAKTTRFEELPVVRDEEGLRAAVEQRMQLRRDLRETVRVLQSNKTALGPELTDQVLSDLNPLRTVTSMSQAGSSEPIDTVMFRRQLDLARARIYQKYYGRSVACFAADPMEMLLAKDMVLAEGKGKQSLHLFMWRNERESAAVNVVNGSQGPIEVQISVSPLRDTEGSRLDSNSVVTKRRAVFVYGMGVGLIADPLVLLGDRAFRLRPGQVGQVWLTVDSSSLEAGLYKGAVAAIVSSGQGEPSTEVISIDIQVDRETMPDAVALNNCNWVYPKSSSVTRDHIAETAKDLKEHYTNVLVVPARNLPYPRPGRSIGSTDWREFDQYIKPFDYSRTYLLYLGLRDNRNRERFGKLSPDAWNRALQAWLIQMVAHLRQKGIGYERFAIYPFDEVLGDPFLEVARLIKQADPKIRIYANSFGAGPADFRRFKGLVDIWCPQDRHCVRYPAWYTELSGFGAKMWTYDALGPGKANDPYHYYRLMPWRAFSRGQTGAGFWIYADETYRIKHRWDDGGVPRGFYGVVYDGDDRPADTQGEHIVPSRRWEAYREGVEDYQYLHELRQLIKDVERANEAASLDARAILERHVRRVLGSREAVAVYEARREICEQLTKLRSVATSGGGQDRREESNDPVSDQSERQR